MLNKPAKPSKLKAEGGITKGRAPVMQRSHPFMPSWLEAQVHKRPWVGLRWVRRYCRYSERASPFMCVTYSSKGIVWPCKPLMGTDLMQPSGCQMSKHFSAALTQQVTRWPTRPRPT
jgi:hypothetical protein